LNIHFSLLAKLFVDSSLPSSSAQHARAFIFLPHIFLLISNRARSFSRVLIKNRGRSPLQTTLSTKIPARAVPESGARKVRHVLCYTKENRTHPEMQDTHERARSVKEQLCKRSSFLRPRKGHRASVIARDIEQTKKRTSRNSSDLNVERNEKRVREARISPSLEK